MSQQEESKVTHYCPKAKRIRCGRKFGWAALLLPITGFAALVWFLIRVIPKPSRAAYPCQRVAMPLASSFVVWLLGMFGSALAFGRTRALLKKSRFVLAGVCLLITVIMGTVAIVNMPARPVMAAPPAPLEPVGEAKGIYPGRVVWVHDPNATDWQGVGYGHWWEPTHTDQYRVDRMVSQAILNLAGESTVAGAWDAIFRHFNQTHDKGNVGYTAGEKIAIKVNLVGCIWSYYTGGVSPDTYNFVSKIDYMNASPQMMLALIRQLVYEVGVDQADISIGDTLCIFPNEYYNMIHPEFPDVVFIDVLGKFNRTLPQFSSVPIYWSTPDAAGKTQDYVPLSYAQAAYLINMPTMKAHGSGMTLCAKNHYGSFIRWPGQPGYYDIHKSLGGTAYVPGYGNYRTMVDIMGHAHLGGKTVLYLIDGLYAGSHTQSSPRVFNMDPFNGDWSSMVLASQDPVAIDSVGFDFLYQEWDLTRMGGVDDYLTEAAEANDPPSGTFYDPDHASDVTRLPSLGVHEHWNDANNKQYSRNLGFDEGIELVKVNANNLCDLNGDGYVGYKDLMVMAGQWCSNTQPKLADIYPQNGDGCVDMKDFARLVAAWNPEPPQNLLVNGNFETGDLTGWTIWHESPGETVEVLHDAGSDGNYVKCSGSHEMGIYQIVSVPNGVEVELSMDWKGQLLNNHDWHEIWISTRPVGAGISLSIYGDYNDGDFLLKQGDKNVFKISGWIGNGGLTVTPPYSWPWQPGSDTPKWPEEAPTIVSQGLVMVQTRLGIQPDVNPSWHAVDNFYLKVLDGGPQLPDETPPQPDPMTWAVVPQGTGANAVRMVATTATDDNDIEYYFDSIIGDGHDSGWQAGLEYIDSGLTNGSSYIYRVKARDLSPNQNETGWSTAVLTVAGDHTSPLPNPMTWALKPSGSGTNSISMTATTATDAGGVEYFFDCADGNCNDSAWQDSSTYVDSGLDVNYTYGYRVKARDKSPYQNETAFSTVESAEPGLDMNTAGMVGWWQFEQNALDSSPSGNDGTLVGNITYQTGRIGYGIDLDGAGDYVNCGNDSTLDLTGNLTVALWLKSRDWNELRSFIAKRNSYSTMDWEFMYINGKIALWYGNSGGNQVFGTLNATLSLNAWHHVCMTRSGNTWTLYVDGLSKGSESKSAAMPTGDTLVIGALDSGGSSSLNGLIDDVRLYNVALSLEEVQALAGL